MQLRPYQSEAIQAVHSHLSRRTDNPCVVIPTGGGKTPIIASLCRDVVQAGGRVAILAHVKELLEQSAGTIRRVAPDVPVGIYSAGLGQKDLGYAVTVAGIQSIWKKAGELGRVDLIIVDEAHMVPADDDGMYREFISFAKIVNPHVRIVGLTATPYRMKSGMICAAENILNHVCYEIGVRELIVRGFLSPLRTKAGRDRIDTSNLHVRAGEFIASEVEDLMDTEALVGGAVGEIIEETKQRRAVLIFASGVQHGRHIVERIEAAGAECGFVTGDTPDGVRAETLERFKSGQLKYLCNVNVLTTGFDAPFIDCVALVRPTMSPGLYYQMVGRGFRLHPGKADCLVLDFGGNVLRHGPVDDIKVNAGGGGTGKAPAKECPQCRELIAAGFGVCPACGFEFPPPERSKHGANAANAAILSDQEVRETFRVMEVEYAEHFKRNDETAPSTLRVEYRVSLGEWKKEWVCFNHEPGTYPYRKACQWWNELWGDLEPKPEMPASVADVVAIAKTGMLPVPTEITTITKGRDFPRIERSFKPVEEQPPEPESNQDDAADDLEHLNEQVPDGTTCGIPDDEIPF